MICSLSGDDKNYSVYIKLYKYLAAKLNTLMNNSDALINIDDIMKNVYEDVLAKTGDHELAIRFTRMVPTAVFNIAGKNMQKIGAMMAKGLDPTATARLAGLAMDPDSGIDYVEKTLGISRNIANEVKDATEAKPKKRPGRKKKEKNDMPEGQLPKDQLLLFDENGDPIIVEVTDEEPEEGVVYPQKSFEAVAPHALKDTDQEALSMDKSSPEYNIVDPAKKLFYKVKRKIVNFLRTAKATDSFNYPGVGKVFLRAVNSSLLPEDVKLKSTAPVVLLVVDKDGNTAVSQSKVANFVSFVGKQAKGAADEQIVFETIKIDGALAVVWTPYRFVFNGTFSHCGVNSFTLVKLNGAWKINYIIDTRHKDNCN
jgi:hypothetical protein